MDLSSPSHTPGTRAVPLRRRALVPLVLLALLGLLVLLMARGLQRDPHALPSALVGRSAPALALPSLDPAQPPLAAGALLGRAWVLNVWASWCEPCTQELPQLQQLAAQGVTVVGLNYKDDAAAARRWLERAGRSPFEASLQDANGHAALDWGVSGVPETFIVDAQGVVRWRHAGALTPQVLQQQFWPLWREFQP